MGLCISSILHRLFPCYLYTAQSIKAESLQNADRQLLQFMLSTGNYEVGLIPINVYAESHYDDGTYTQQTLFSAYTTEPIEVAGRV